MASTYLESVSLTNNKNAFILLQALAHRVKLR